MRVRPEGRLGRIAGLLVAVAMLASSIAAADSGGRDDQLQEIVVTAQRRTENAQDVPLSITAFSERDIDTLGIRSTADIGKITPNVSIALPSGAGNQPIITIRGIGLNDFNTNNAGPNGVYADEVYLSSPSSQTFSIFDLEQIEVLKGPQGTLYGRNTSGGAINFVSKKPTDQTEGDFHFEGSSYDTFNFEGGIGGQIAPNLDARIAAVINRSSGYGYNDLTGNRENGASNEAARVQFLWTPTDSLKVLLNLHGAYLDNRPTEYRHVGDIDPNSGAQCTVQATLASHCVDAFGQGVNSNYWGGAYNRQQHLKVHNTGAALRIDDTFAGLTFTSLSSFEHNTKFHPEDSDASPLRLLEVDYGVITSTVTQEFRLSHAEEKYNWVAGLYYLREDLRQDQNAQVLLDLDDFLGPGGGDGLAYVGFGKSHQVTDSYAAYGQGDYNLTDALKLTLGARVTHDHRSFLYQGDTVYQQGGIDSFGSPTNIQDSNAAFSNTAFSWRAGLDYRFTKAIHAYVSAATGFKSGDFNGGFLSTDPAEASRQLRPVEPEKVTSYEVGLKSEFFDNRVIFNIAAFYNDYRDMQVYVLVAPPPTSTDQTPLSVLDNAQKAHTSGIDAELTAKPFSNFTVDAKVGALRTRLDHYISQADASQPDYSGNVLPLAPRLSLSLTLDYQIPIGPGKADLQLNTNYKSHQYFDVSNDPYTTQDGYWLTNARAAYQFNNNLEIAAFVHNLGNKKYLNDSVDLTPTFGFIEQIVGEPRFWGGEINYHF
jgi:iron complex outermembrane recepter protein